MRSNKKQRRKTARPKKLLVLLPVVLLATLLLGCQQNSTEMQNGYYTAIAAEYGPTGWKEYITIFVSNDTIVSVEYNARNASGFIKSWDMQYMRVMNASDGTYPNEYVREYSESLLNRQDPAKVDVVAGATHSHESFQLLAQAAMQQARAGDKSVAFVDIPEDWG